MKTAPSAPRATHKKWLNILAALALLTMAFPVTIAVHAEADSPFLGAWQATDPADGSDIRVAIGGRPTGPFQITWTESYLSFCSGGPGIVRGTGHLNSDDPNLLESQLRAECFTSGSFVDFQWSWEYHPQTGTLSSLDSNGRVTIWSRPGHPAPAPPPLDLVVNYGDDSVLSVYEAGHTAWLTVTESDGLTVKATAQVLTGPSDFPGGETGFHTTAADWTPARPDIQPNDWVYGWLDNGADARVQIGDIRGQVDLMTASVSGTIFAPWLDSNTAVAGQCLPWGAPDPLPNRDISVRPDGADEFSCSWDGLWYMQPQEPVAVAYTGPDGQWVANTFNAPKARIVASEVGDWFWTTGFNPGQLDLAVYEALDAANPKWTGQQEADASGFTIVNPSIDLVPGNYVVVSDGVNTKALVLQHITVEFFDTALDLMTGTAPAGSQVWVAAGPQDWQKGMMVSADPVTGAWAADFSSLPYDITEEMQPWSYAQVFDDDGDANEADPGPLELWSAAFTYDVGIWTPGEHTYSFEASYSVPAPRTDVSPEFPLTVAQDAASYNGYALLRVGRVVAASDSGCTILDPPDINPGQWTRFVYGWITDYPMTYQEALAHFNSLTVTAYADGAALTALTPHEIHPGGATPERQQYMCSFTQPGT